MKKIIILILFGLLIISCKKESDRIENELFKCLIGSISEDEKEKLIPLIRDFENHLIEKGILASSEAKSYWKLYNQIAETGIYDFSNEFNFSKKISFLNRQNSTENEGFINCHRNVLQSEKYLASKLFEFNQEMQSRRNDELTPIIIAKTTVKHLTIEDFELEYNRFNTLMFVENFK